MQIQEIHAGDKANLQMVWLNQTIELKSTVAAVVNDKIILTPYRYEGEFVDINEIDQSDIVVNLYYINPSNDARVVWRNVYLKSTTMDGKEYYLVEPGRINKISENDERRAYQRIPLDFSATLTDLKYDSNKLVDLINLNNGGIAFLLPSNDELRSNDVKIYIEDVARDKQFKLEVECHIVRHERYNDAKTLYGCRIVRPFKELLAYICMKRLEYKMALKGNRY